MIYEGKNHLDAGFTHTKTLTLSGLLIETPQISILYFPRFSLIWKSSSSSRKKVRNATIGTIHNFERGEGRGVLRILRISLIFFIMKINNWLTSSQCAVFPQIIVAKNFFFWSWNISVRNLTDLTNYIRSLWVFFKIRKVYFFGKVEKI